MSEKSPSRGSDGSGRKTRDSYGARSHRWPRKAPYESLTIHPKLSFVDAAAFINTNPDGVDVLESMSFGRIALESMGAGYKIGLVLIRGPNPAYRARRELLRLR